MSIMSTVTLERENLSIAEGQAIIIKKEILKTWFENVFETKKTLIKLGSSCLQNLKTVKMYRFVPWQQLFHYVSVFLEFFLTGVPAKKFLYRIVLSDFSMKHISPNHTSL